MSGKKKGNGPDTGNIDAEFEPDEGNIEHPDVVEAGDEIYADEEFDWDTALIPEGINLVDLAPDFIRPEGFLMVPRLNKRTGEVFPMSTTFVGILHDIVTWKDNRGKERLWFACEATAAVAGARYTGRDERNVEFTKAVEKGTRIGISGSGAINALKTKKGHFIALHWTGNKVTVKNGDMWEVKAKVSDKPVIVTKET